MLAIELMHMKFHGNELEQVPVRYDDANRHARIVDYLFCHCRTPYNLSFSYACRAGREIISL